MSLTEKHISIPKNVASNNDLDYSFLKQKGLEYIEQLSSNLWTDYNSHDPGITILEMLCYAITDLGLRIEMPIENILAPENNSSPKIEQQFFKASQILPSKPVTELDYRKLFIDIEGVKNCWLKPYSKTIFADCQNDILSYDPDQFKEIPDNFKRRFALKGLYSVTIDLSQGKKLEDVTGQILKRFHANRNLCEDLVEINQIKEQPISVCYTIELDSEANEELVEAKISLAIENYFSPGIKFYTLKQLFDKGYTSDEIFNGPILNHGFIDQNELKEAGLRTEVRLSDIMQLIMAIPEVKYIKDISISNGGSEMSESEIWRICITEGRKPVRCKNSGYSYYKGVLPLNINKIKVEEYKEELKEKEKNELVFSGLNWEIEIPSGTYLNTSETTTIQNDFPDTYGIGLMGLPLQVETVRKSKAKQLKGYLLFFDQVLATYFAHLGKVKEVLSVDNQIKKTYFTQAVTDIRNFSELVSNYPTSDSDELTKILFNDLDNHIVRKNRLLDHLLARFAEKFNDYAFLMKQLYGDNSDVAVIKTKENFLKNYSVLGIERGAAFNYYLPKSSLWDTENVSTVEKRIALLIGMTDYTRRNLSNDPLEIYQEKDDDGLYEYRWRIKDFDQKVLCSSSKKYFSTEKMYREIFLVKALATDYNNYEIKKAISNKYYYNLTNPNIPDINDEDHIIARRLEYFDTEDAAQKAIRYFISFMKKVKPNEGMYLIEHILLRPDESINKAIPADSYLPVCTDNCESCTPIDPYSYRVTVILPGWTERFSNIDFRKFTEDLIRKELPAHILARICWIGYPAGKVDNDENEMLRLEKLWKAFLFAKTKKDQIQKLKILIDLIKILGELNSIYPAGRLIDCDNEDDSLEGKIILGKTNIGTINL